MEQTEKKSISHFTAGLIISGLLIIYSMFLTFMDLTANQSLSYLSMVFLMVGIIFFVNQYCIIIINILNQLHPYLEQA